MYFCTMRKPKACILDQIDAPLSTELSIGFTSTDGDDDPFAEIPAVLLDVPHEVFRGMGPGQPQAKVQTYWLARDWGEA